MNGWTVALVAAWVLLLLLAALVLSLMRQVGLLLMRVNPTGALSIGDEGPLEGSIIPAAQYAVLGTEPPDEDGIAMAVFVSVGCGACERLAPGLRTFQRTYRRTRVLVSGDAWHLERAADRMKGVELSEDRGLTQTWTIKNTPYAIALDSVGMVVGKGIVNTLDQLEELRSRSHSVILARKTARERLTNEMANDRGTS